MANHCHEVSLLEGKLRMRKWRSGSRFSHRAHALHSLAAITEQPRIDDIDMATCGGYCH